MKQETKIGVSKEGIDAGIDYMKKNIFGPKLTEDWLAALRIEGDDWEKQVAGWTFGYIFQRPGLDLKTRVLLAIAMLSAQLDVGAERQLKLWLKAALRMGIKEVEIREVLGMTQLYTGSARCRRSRQIYNEIVAELKTK